jgi:hypothetical protein
MEIFNEHGKPINLKIEIVEQELVQKYIKPEDRVLELGARYGSVSIRTNKIVNDKSSHYVVEPDSAIWECLENNMKINDCNFNIIKGVIAKDKYSVCQKNYSTYTYKDENSKTQSYDLPDVDFNVLIVDCEGFFQTFYEENKSLFPKLETIIFEGDEPQRCDYDYLLSEFDKLGFKVIEKIKEPTCENMWHYVLQKDKKPKILFTSLSDRPEWSKPNYENIQDYCDRYGYKFITEDKILCKDRHQSWSKILLLQREMKANQDYDYVVWIDDDILICDKNKRFEEFLNEKFDSLLICDDIAINPFNCGFMVFKNNKSSYKMCQDVWELGEKYSEWKQRPNWEQECFKIYYNELISKNKNQTEIKILPHRTLQSIHMKYKNGDFSIHFAGIHNMKIRSKKRDEVLTFIQ